MELKEERAGQRRAGTGTLLPTALVFDTLWIQWQLLLFRVSCSVPENISVPALWGTFGQSSTAKPNPRQDLCCGKNSADSAPLGEREMFPLTPSAAHPGAGGFSPAGLWSRCRNGKVSAP